MTPQELATLSPWFSEGERYTNGQIIDWSSINYQTMWWMTRLRSWLDAPIRLIRGAHPNRPEAVDACCPSVSLSRVFMELCRLPMCSWGLYSGNSFHLDTRPGEKPARWLAIRPHEAHELQSLGLQNLGSVRDGWLYLPWSHDRGFDVLTLVLKLADRRARSES